ncbi:MAG TPA: VOC family protein, partial [Polyangiaceae bacterium]|nr:VOC family protein [Polyangiaceae bacterium]
MGDKDNEPKLLSICPHFIVAQYRSSVDYYRGKLGFVPVIEVPEGEPFFAVVKRGGATIALKEIASEIPPMPNSTRHEWARWDAFVDTLNPDQLYEEYCAKGVTIHRPIADT